MAGMSDLVLAKIEQIEELHEREREIYREIREMGELVYDNAWDKLAKEIVEARADARRLTEDANGNIASFNWMFEPDAEIGDEPSQITAQKLWEEISPKLRDVMAGDSKALQMIDQIDRLSAMAAA